MYTSPKVKEKLGRNKEPVTITRTQITMMMILQRKTNGLFKIDITFYLFL